MFYRYRDTHLLRVGDPFSLIVTKKPLVFPKAFLLPTHPVPAEHPQEKDKNELTCKS
jgi:hypothetical protein